ncbi:MULTISPECIES: GNAT family N-acetyltransferase [Shewanella]|uniref:GNAT family N-acetyltransferase n=2 Tax=Shewanella TaxID=22 RepID=A0A9X3AQU2_9GAMM|nr:MULTISPECIES: GNAT family N-acetyltransferase [Shewanella]KZK68485.1 acetyltransferase [Shewanella baltica]MCT7943292.1 GNAT family N-acetyltransferase [Shewanella holmiensis]MDT3280020.1 GNAT family N-acetyltransferase [Shewanella sp. SP2S1-2]
MLEIKPIENLEEISTLKQAYFAQSTAPLDGMWHFGFVPMSTHFGFYEQETLVGYCCINGEGYMLQFYLSNDTKMDAKELFTLIAEQNNSVIGAVNGAFVSTAEPQYLSLSLDNASAVKVNSLMYKQKEASKQSTIPGFELKLAESEQLEQFVEFAATTIGAPEQWLTGYFGNLINRKELFGYWSENELIATGECRLFDEYQTGYADLGMIVAQSQRGKGIATQMLNWLVNSANQRGLTPICSTESSNVGAQKAIKRAGLSSSNRIVQVEFNNK